MFIGLAITCIQAKHGFLAAIAAVVSWTLKTPRARAIGVCSHRTDAPGRQASMNDMLGICTLIDH